MCRWRLAVAAPASSELEQRTEAKLDCMSHEHRSTRQDPKEKKLLYFLEKDLRIKSTSHHTFAYVLLREENNIPTPTACQNMARTLLLGGQLTVNIVVSI